MPPLLRHDQAQRQRFRSEAQDLACPICAGTARFDPGVRQVTCPSCQAPLVRGPDDATPLAPTGVLPFRIDEGSVAARAAAGITSRWAARPAGARLTAFERVYVPMWRFTTHVVCSWASETRGSDGTITRTTGEFTDDYARQVAASSDVNGDLLQLLEDVPLEGAAPFSAARVAGARLLPIDVPAQDAWLKAKREFDDRAMSGTASEGYSAWPHWSREEGALVLVPAYLGREETRHISVPVLVDGTTGAVHGGIGNGPFAAAPGPLSTAATVGCGVVLLAVMWLVLWRLGLTAILIDLLGALVG